MSVVIPLASVDRLPLLFAGLPPVSEIIVVVGPGEATVLPLPRAARVIRQTRHGAGNAIACGVAAATGDVIVTLPGDGSCDPADLPRLVEALGTSADPACDVAEGVRTPRRSDLVLLWFMSVLLGCRPSGPGAGFRAFRRNHADRLGLPRVAGTDPDRGDGRDVEPLLTARSRAAGLRVAEIPVTYYPPIGGTALLPGLAGILREGLARRRGAPASGAESIVILTGGPSHHEPGEPGRRTPGEPSRRTPGEPGRPTLADLSRLTSGDPARPIPAPIFVGPVNTPRRPGADHRPTDPGLRRWPAPNRITATGADHPNSAGIGIADRRRGSDRRGPERRRTDATPDRRAVTGRPGNDRPNADSPHRRRWRDGQTDLNTGRRPDLRVINGEGSGSGGTRGHLRSV